jgi:hypothetical protein
MPKTEKQCRSGEGTDDVSGAVAAEEWQERVELACLVSVGKRVEEVVAHHVEHRTPGRYPLAAAVPERRGEVGEGELVTKGG